MSETLQIFRCCAFTFVTYLGLRDHGYGMAVRHTTALERARASRLKPGAVASTATGTGCSGLASHLLSAGFTFSN